MRDPARRRASKRAYYERHRAELQEKARKRYAAERESDAKEAPAPRAPRRAISGHDTERRQASKKAYYRRMRAELQEKARERMRRLRASQDAQAIFSRRLKHMAYRTLHNELLRLRKLNLYRKRWILKNGVDRFLREFRGRAQARQGELLEHWDHNTLTEVARVARGEAHVA